MFDRATIEKPGSHSVGKWLKSNLPILMTGLLAAMGAHGQPTLSECFATEDEARRLGCYDRALERPAAPPAPLASGIWESRILADADRETFTFTARKPNYLIYSYQDDPNLEPYELTGRTDEIEDQEIKFQLSLQTKVAEDLFGRSADLWFSYTQVAYWQLFSDDISAPFRETNYEPEVYVSFLTDVPILGLKARNINVGVVHQSNGRGEVLSRSWNRVFAEFQFVRGDFALTIKPWYRIEEDAEDDNNPDIDDYLGYYELRGLYHWNNHIFSVMGRNLFDSDNRENVELMWSFPISGRLRGMVQWYNGYGENLIDYDHDSNRIGLGVMMTDWL